MVKQVFYQSNEILLRPLPSGALLISADFQHQTLNWVHRSFYHADHHIAFLVSTFLDFILSTHSLRLLTFTFSLLVLKPIFTYSALERVFNDKTYVMRFHSIKSPLIICLTTRLSPPQVRMCPSHRAPSKSPQAVLSVPLWPYISASQIVITDLCLISFSTALVQCENVSLMAYRCTRSVSWKTHARRDKILAVIFSMLGCLITKTQLA